MAEHHEFQRLLIEYPDRLARLGYHYWERHWNSHGVTIESTPVHQAKTSSEELTEDLLTIITVFRPDCTASGPRSFVRKHKN